MPLTEIDTELDYGTGAAGVRRPAVLRGLDVCAAAQSGSSTAVKAMPAGCNRSMRKNQIPVSS